MGQRRCKQGASSKKMRVDVPCITPLLQIPALIPTGFCGKLANEMMAMVVLGSKRLL
jgi:hypothetical protein